MRLVCAICVKELIIIEYILTEKGREKVTWFIKECAAKRKEILDAGIDTADDTNLPTEEAI